MNNINLIAQYEFQLLLRDWTFRFLAIAGLCLVLGGHYLLQCQEGVAEWNFVALFSSVPLLGVYLLNYIQVAILFFSGRNISNRNKKVDTVDVLYSRPIENVEFVIGKILGTCLAILLFDVVVMMALMVVHLSFSPAPLGLFYYIFYPLVLLVPSLVFWSGVILWIKSSIANQGLALLAMAGGFMLAILAASKGFWAIDVLGHEVPNVFSDITGYEGISFLLSQRLFILLFGSGFWCFGLTCWKRIPNSLRMKRRCIMAGMSIFVISILIPLGWWKHFKHDDSRRTFYQECQRHWEDSPKGLIRSHDIRFIRNGVRIEVESDLLVLNTSGEDMTDIVLYLNPGLEISELTLDNKLADFYREGQVVVIRHALPVEDSVRLHLLYKGKIDDRVCYPDIAADKYRSWKVDPDYLPYRASRCFSYVGDEYTLLTPECLWYPVTEPPVRLCGLPREMQFTRFSLNVREEKGKIVVSQGNSRKEKGWILFKGKHDYPGLSLCIGNYEWKRMNIDGILFEFYYFKGHNFFKSRIAPDGFGIRRLLESPYYDYFAKWVGVPDRVVLVETPLTFWAYERAGSPGSDYVQAEIFFGPEHGMGLYGIPFASENDWQTNDMIPDIVLASFFWDRLPSNYSFIGRSIGLIKNVERANKRNIQCMFSNYRYSIKSERFPAINTLLQGIKKQWSPHYGGVHFNMRDQGRCYLAKHSFLDALRDRDMDFVFQQQILDLKAKELKKCIVSMISEEEWDRFISGFLNRNLYKNVDVDELCENFKEQYGGDLMKQLEHIYQSRELPFFRVKDVYLEKINGKWGEYMCRAKVWNRSHVDGWGSMFCSAGGISGVEKSFLIKAGECKEIKIKFSGDVFREFYLLTNLSRNLPEEFEMTDPVRETNDTLTGIFDIDTTCFIVPATEIIVDNRDAGFNMKNSRAETFFGRFFENKRDMLLQNSFFSIFTTWQSAISSSCYGDEIRDIHYMTATGKGGKAEWNATLPEDGMYEVWVYNPRQLLKEVEPVIYEYAQKYTIYADQVENVEMNLFREFQGWVTLGKYYFKQGETKVILHDEVYVDESQIKQHTAGMSVDYREELYPIVFADAVKWVQVIE